MTESQLIRKAMGALGKRKSLAKSASSRANGSKGGRPGIDWSKWDARLCKDLDRVIAAEIGCPVNTVAQRRLRLGIAAYQAK
jgi:hypothetical protein